MRVDRGFKAMSKATKMFLFFFFSCPGGFSCFSSDYDNRFDMLLVVI